jgi:ATP-binding cassette subfamily B protein
MNFARSSRQRYLQYREEVRKRKAEKEQVSSSPHGTGPVRKAGPRQRSTTALLRAFWGFLQGQRGPVIWSLLTLTVATLLGLIPPASTKFVVDNVLGSQPLPAWLQPYLPADKWHLLISLTVAVTVLSAVRVALKISGRWAGTRATKRVQMAVRKRVMEHAVRLPLPRVQELKSGGMASLLREDAGGVGELIFGLLYNPWRAVVQLVGSLCILAVVDWRLLLGALVVIPAVFLSHRTWILEIRPRFRDVRAQRQLIDGQATETFAGMRVVRAFGRQRTETARIMTNTHLMGRQELFVWWWMRVIEIVWELLIPIGSGALLLYGGWRVLNGLLTVGELMMFLVYLVMLLEPLAILAESAATLQNSLSGLDRVLDLLGEPREMESTHASLRVSRDDVLGRVTFDDVSFRYSADSPWALQNIVLDVNAGETIALVGPSGAGKTTLCNLVARFYDPTTGTVRLDGTDLKEIDVESYRGLLGVVEQDVFLFDGTVAENIAYGLRDATLAAIEEAARIANADEFIRKLPKGYETIVGERGVKLSGGQRQRIAIARALVADPRILILDEATSNLDTESERLIQQSLQSLMRGRTSFIIAHRLSTIRHANRILVIENGQIIEAGTHDELVALGGRYRRMVELQASLDTEQVAAEVLESSPA